MSVISGKRQVTIPADMLREAGIEPGDEVHLRAVGPGRIEVLTFPALIEELAGTFDRTVYPPGYLEDVRRGWA